MAKAKRVNLSLAERIARLKKSGISEVPEAVDPEDILAPLPARIRSILGIVHHQPAHATNMNYLIMYDITDNKVRKLVAQYLKSQGCIRIQKSVFMANSTHGRFQDIHDTLKEVNEQYENEDSIMLVPVNVADVRSMKLIGKNVSVDILTDPPTTVFF
jgi:CRISPR-associated protein Cas2